MPLFSFEGLQPRIHPSAFVAPTATLVGDVIVEERRVDLVRRGDPRRLRARDRPRAAPTSRTTRSSTVRRASLPTSARASRSRTTASCTARSARAAVHRRQRFGRARRRHDRCRRADRRGLGGAAGVSIPAGMLAAGSPATVRRPVKGSGAETWVEMNPGAYAELAQRHRTGIAFVDPKTAEPAYPRRSEVEARLAFGPGRRDRVHVAFPQDQVLLAADLDFEAGVGREQHPVAGLDRAHRGPGGDDFGPDSRRSTLAVAGMRIPARDLRSPVSGDGASRSRSAVMRMECLTSSWGSSCGHATPG